MQLDFLKSLPNTVGESLPDLSVITDTVTDTVDAGGRFIKGAAKSVSITVAGIELELDSKEAASILYDALIPQVAQSLLNGRLPSRDDFKADAIAWVGGPIEGVYVAAHSTSATLIANGEVPSAEQLGRDMIGALTPVAKRKLGL